MGLFRSQHEFRKLFDELFELLSTDAEAGPKLRGFGTTQRYEVEDLGLVLEVGPADAKKAAKGSHLAWGWKPGKKGPDVVLRMTAEVAHRYFVGKENVPLAVAKGRIAVVEGDLKRVLDLLPVVIPFQKKWVARLKSTGRTALLEA